MKSRYHILSMIMLLGFALVQAQDQSQALRFSENFINGTAKYNSMGGALGAVGGDFTAVSANPAGLGLYRSSEFTITPIYTVARSRTNITGDPISDQGTNLSIGNLGLVSSYSSKRDKGFVGFNLAFGYNTLNDYYNRFNIEGENNYSSLLDNFVLYANTYGTLDPFYEELAWETSLMPYDTVSGEYWHDLQPYSEGGYDGYGQWQSRVVERRGHLGEYAFSAAINISHKLYLGGTLGIHAVRYYEDIQHTEEDLSRTTPLFESFEFGEYNSTRGFGYALKLGLIYKPVHMLRIGASFHAPVKYYLTDEKYTSMRSFWDSDAGIADDYASSEMYYNEYVLTTPMRTSVSAAMLFGKLGMLSAEYEFVDYTTARMSSSDYDFVYENSRIRQDFLSSHHIKVGAELRLKNLILRAGGQYNTSPLTEELRRSGTLIYSAGMGFNFGQSYLDLAYLNKSYSDYYGMYEYMEGVYEQSDNKYSVGRFMLTLGYKF